VKAKGRKILHKVEELLNIVYFQVASLLDKIIVNKEKNISLYHVIALFIKDLKKNHIQSEANSVAYNFMLAIFPAIIFLFTLIPYIPIDNLSLLIINSFESLNLLPESIYEEAVLTINDIVNKPRGGLLSLGFLTALFLSTNGMLALMRAFNRCYKTSETRSNFTTRMVAIFLTVILTLVLIFGVALIFSGKFLQTYLAEIPNINEERSYELIRIGEYIAFLFLFWIAISTIYYFGPSLQNRWRFFSIGSIFCTFMALFASMLFAYYVNNFGTYNKIYGSIGTLIGFMIWLKIISLILLIGFEINVSIQSAKRGIKVNKTLVYQRFLVKKTNEVA